MGQFRNFKHYYLSYVSTSLASDFSDLLSYNRFIQIEHRVVIPLLMFIRLIGFGSCTGISFVDSTKIAVCHNKRISTNRVFRGMAEIGKSTMGWFYGFKLHLVCNDRGELLNFCLTKGMWTTGIRKYSTHWAANFSGIYSQTRDIYQRSCLTCFGMTAYIWWQESRATWRISWWVWGKILYGTLCHRNHQWWIKNICQIEHSRHRGKANFLMNLISGIAAYCLFDKKPSIKYEIEDTYGQLTLFG